MNRSFALWRKKRTIHLIEAVLVVKEQQLREILIESLAIAKYCTQRHLLKCRILKFGHEKLIGFGGCMTNLHPYCMYQKSVGVRLQFRLWNPKTTYYEGRNLENLYFFVWSLKRNNFTSTKIENCPLKRHLQKAILSYSQFLFLRDGHESTERWACVIRFISCRFSFPENLKDSASSAGVRTKNF